MPAAPSTDPAVRTAPSRWRAVALAGLGCLVLALTVTPITNNDIFLHLRTGGLILESGHVPRVDDYSALARGRPFIAHEWLAGVIFRLALAAGGGLSALIVLKCAVALAIAGTLYRVARTWGAAATVALPCLGLVMVLAAARFIERPHIFAWLLLAIYLLALARRSARRDGGRPGGSLLSLIPLQILWANLHGSFFVGPGVVVLAAAAQALEGLGVVPWTRRADPLSRDERLREAARLAAMGALLILACLLNPYGPALLRFPFALTGSAFMGLIYEWQPPYTAPFRTTYMALYYVVWAVLGAAGLAATLLRSRRAGRPPAGLFHVLLFGAFFALSLRMNRNVTDFALATVPGVSALFTWVLESRGERRRVIDGSPGGRIMLRWIAGTLLALAAWFAVAGYAYSPSGRREVGLGVGGTIPVAAADYLQAAGISGNCFNTYSAGAYLIYRFYPAVRVGMDSRNDVYGESLYTDYTRALTSAPDLTRMLSRLDASFLFIEWPQSGIVETARMIRTIPGAWRPVYFDDAAMVYLSAEGRYASVAGRDGYDLLDPALFLPGSWSPAESSVALREAERAVATTHGAYIARVMRVEALRGLGRVDEARIEEERIVAEDPSLAHIHALLGLIHLARGEKPEAEARLRRSLSLNPYSDGARAAYLRATGGR